MAPLLCVLWLLLPPGEAAHPLVTADILRSWRSGDGCALDIRIRSLDPPVPGAAPRVAVGERLTTTVSCHQFAMHGMSRPGAFRFLLELDARGRVRAWGHGGRLVRTPY